MIAELKKNDEKSVSFLLQQSQSCIYQYLYSPLQQAVEYEINRFGGELL